MKRLVLTLMIIAIPYVAHPASMCMLPGGGATSAVNAPTGVGNRGFWTVGDKVFGETHCSTIGIITSGTISNFENDGTRVWCRITHVVAPNGFMARHNGPWVLANANHGSGCHSNDASVCASNFNNNKSFRRVALTAMDI